MKKRALVTGASRGIGAATARALAADGWEVNLNYFQSEAQALALAEELGCRAFRADVADPAQVRAMFQAMGPVELLVNNAGIAHDGLITDITEEEWHRLFDVNVGGVFNCVRCALPHMIHEKHGIIINTSSVLARYGGFCEAAYTATKSAVEGLTRSLARELGPSGIRVNAVAPGVIETDMLACFTREELDDMADKAPIERNGVPEDVARVTALLASDACAFVTGAIIPVDGGNRL